MSVVRGTQPERPLELEFSVDTVYERANIRRFEQAATAYCPAFWGWEYDEVQYTYQEWYKKDSIDTKLAIAELAEKLLGGTK